MLYFGQIVKIITFGNISKTRSRETTAGSRSVILSITKNARELPTRPYVLIPHCLKL